ncbi:MAG: hypothetical protein ABJL44_16965 [Algibacter sp.]
MKNIICFLLLVTSMTFAQNTTKLKVLESPEFKDKVKSGDVLSMHTSPLGLTGVVRYSKIHLLFDVFNESLDRIKNSLIETNLDEDFCGELIFKNTIKVFTVLSPSKKERVIYCHEFNINDGSHKRTKLFKTDVEKNQRLFSGSNKRETGFAMSPNGSYFVVSTDDIKKHSNSYTVRVYNSETLNLVFKQTFQENTEKFYEANDLSIDDDANVYALGKVFLEGRSEKKGGKANYDFVLNKITELGNQVINIEFSKEEHISSLIISNVKNKIRLIGFYSDKRAGRIKGSLIFDVATDSMTITKQNAFKLPETVYKDLYTENKAKKKKDVAEELSNYYVDYVLEDDKGNTYLLAEEFFVTQVYVYNGMGGGSYTQSVPHYNNVLVKKINAEGQLEWGRSIFKRSLVPSYSAFLKEGQLHVILNSGKNLNEKEDGRVKVSKGFLESTALYDIVFNEGGDVSYDKIQDNKGNTFYTPFYGVYDDERFITISKVGGGKKQFLILE